MAIDLVRKMPKRPDLSKTTANVEKKNLMDLYKKKEPVKKVHTEIKMSHVEVKKPQAEIKKGAIHLEKYHDKHVLDLSKGKDNISIHANLNWNQRGVDLDLGCMVEFEGGFKMVIQPLGGNFGNKNGFPFIYLDKDDRSGAAKDGENMYVLYPKLVKRILFFALIYKGASNFRSIDGIMSFGISNGEIITLKLDSPDYSSKFCAAAMFENHNGTFSLVKEAQYFAGHSQADAHYKFGFNWVEGRK
jgi:tellurite resistance protein TerA